MTGKQMTPQERMAGGHRASTPPVKPPAAFRPVAEFERLRALRDTDPTAFRAALRGRRIAFGFYEAARAAAGYEGDGDGNDAA